jgi:hypothetical protein
VPPDDPEIAALTDILASGSGLAVLPTTIKYLDERAQAEIGWLESLHESCIPTTLIWGIHDIICPIRVPNYVWATYLRSRVEDCPLTGALREAGMLAPTFPFVLAVLALLTALQDEQKPFPCFLFF